MNKAKPQNSSIHVATCGIVPEEPGNDSRNNEAHQKNELDIMAMLPLDNIVLREVADVRNTWSPAGFDEHPAHVRPPETFVGIVRVQVGISVAVVRTVASRPPLDGALNGTCSGQSKEVLKWLRRVVGPVRPQAVVASRDAFFPGLKLRVSNYY